MTAVRNPYEVLGIPSGADPQAIRRAYKKLAVQFHPDRDGSPEAVARFKEVSEAYAVLTNERERQRYARRRRREHAEREEVRRKQAAEAHRRTTQKRSETAQAAERVFWEYARQVQARREQASRTHAASRTRPNADWWGDRVSPLLALILIAAYVWRSTRAQPLQPWLPASMFASHPLSSPIWITIVLGLLMIVRPRWFQIPLVLEELKEVRLIGWAMVLLPPLLSSGMLWLTQLGMLPDWY